MNIEPCTLEGRHVRLEPLTLDHLAPLSEVGLAEPETFRWWLTSMRRPEDMRQFIEAAMQQQAEGKSLPFATLDAASGRPVGSTRFMNIERSHRVVEIGTTWIAPAWQRSAINTEAKLLLLRHAFEVWQCNRVELKTDALNQRSRQAILRLGAKEEGLFRSHLIVHDGRLRDTAWYSIIAAEWPAVKAALKTRLDRGQE